MSTFCRQPRNPSIANKSNNKSNKPSNHAHQSFHHGFLITSGSVTVDAKGIGCCIDFKQLNGELFCGVCG